METKFWHQSRTITQLKNNVKNNLLLSLPTFCQYQCIYKKFIKIHQLVHKILGINEFRHQSMAITLLKMNKKYCSIFQIYILSISMHIPNLIEIHKLINKKLSINKILTSIKSHNSVKNWPKIMCFRYNGSVYINACTKFYQTSSICSENIEEKHIFTSTKGHNSVVYKQI